MKKPKKSMNFNDFVRDLKIEAALEGSKAVEEMRLLDEYFKAKRRQIKK